MYLLNVLTWLAGWSHVMSLTCDRGGLLLLSGDEYACVGLSVCFVGDLCDVVCFFFFFSSRRRHTRCGRDWSSDVCSSDLGPRARPGRPGRARGPGPTDGRRQPAGAGAGAGGGGAGLHPRAVGPGRRGGAEIGRASCRERGKMSRGARTENTQENSKSK